MNTKITKICRLCTRECENNIAELFNSEEVFYIHLIYTEEFKIKITKDDGITQAICFECRKIIEKILTFLKQCEYANTVLKQNLLNFETSQTEPTVEIKTEKNINELNFIHLKEDIKQEEIEFVETDLNDICMVNVSEQLNSYFQEIKEEDPMDFYPNFSRDESDKDEKNSLIKQFVSSESDSDCNELLSSNQNITDDETKYSISLIEQPKPKNLTKKKSEKLKKKKLSCDLCGKEFSKEANLDSHYNKHKGIRPYNCKICEKTFTNRNRLRLHLKNHDNIVKYKCNICGTEFTHKSFYKIHLNRHETGEINEKNEEQYKCVFCPQTFTNLTDLTTHDKIHKNESGRQYPCTECRSNFHRSDRLREHMNRVHLKILPYKCEICGKGFLAGYLRNRHVKDYHSGKRHICEICNKEFALADSLTKHLRIHTNDKRYVCDICNSKFLTIYWLDKHINTCHSEAAK